MRKHRRSVKGIVVPIKWDKGGQIRKIAIMTFDEDMLVVADNYFHRMMNHHLRKTVTVDGEVYMKGNMKQIIVQRLFIHPE